MLTLVDVQGDQGSAAILSSRTSPLEMYCSYVDYLLPTGDLNGNIKNLSKNRYLPLFVMIADYRGPRRRLFFIKPRSKAIS